MRTATRASRQASSPPTRNESPSRDVVADDAFQDELLQQVSRTFALTIPQLPPGLRRVVSNAYLLCRIVDTIEDEPNLDAAEKRSFCTRFAAVVSGEATPEPFSSALSARLSVDTPVAERQLIAQTPEVLAITDALAPAQRAALRVCVQVMADGMASFQEARSASGLANLVDLDRYCYYVAGVVGEMLTRLFCEYSPEIAQHREALMRLAVSFGQGLQMTNVLKDIWEDKARGACWLPQDVFREYGVDLAAPAHDARTDDFGRGLQFLVGIAHGHLRNALRYTLLIPKHEQGIRQFCLWAIGMALLTLRKIARNPRFSRGTEVKISRRSVKLVVVVSRLCVRNDAMLKALFRLAAAGLPRARFDSRHDVQRPATPAAR